MENEKLMRIQRKKKLQSGFRELNPTWNFGWPGFLKPCFVFLAVAVAEVVILWFQETVPMSAVAINGALLILFAMVYGLRPASPFRAAKGADKTELTKMFPEIAKYTKVLALLPVKRRDFEALCFERWWWISVLSMLLNNVIVWSTMIFFQKEITGVFLLAVITMTLFPVFLFFYEINLLFIGETPGVIGAFLGGILPFFLCLFPLGMTIAGLVKTAGAAGETTEFSGQLYRLSLPQMMLLLLIDAVLSVVFYLIVKRILRCGRICSFLVDGGKK